MPDIYEQACKTMAELIYDECFGQLDDRPPRGGKIQQIYWWLLKRDRADLQDMKLKDLVKEWREYDPGNRNLNKKM